ncbi:hypothetical protein HanPSC8_Chr09g0375691 [Helianthus annuus]|nr:hypothetical protein HanPSC8_Chr09g0375691 [Helianthus annuus]
MACKKSIEIPNFFAIFYHYCPSPNTPASLFSHLNPITFLHSSIAAMKRLDFRRFPSPLYSIITIHTREK